MKPFPPPQWQTLSANVHKTDLGDNLPEVVIFTLSNEAFRKFSKSRKAAMQFIDRLGILKAKLINLIFGDITPDVVRPGGVWIVITSHTTKSTAVVIGWQLPAEPEPQRERIPLSELRKPPSKRRIPKRR
jgi:hypothetical protein